MMSLEEIITHPLTAVSAVISSLSYLFQIPGLDAVLAVLWGQVEILFTAVSVFAFSVVPNIGLGPLAPIAGWTRIVAVVLGIAYGLKLLAQVYDRIQMRLRNQNR